jgi:peptidoglycan/LPS O-acetylase OafA/YrhL
MAPKVGRQTTEQFGSVQVLRAVAALMVVLWHSQLALKYLKNNYWPYVDPSLRQGLYPFYVNHLYIGVDIFFCISGFIMCMLVTKGGEDTFMNYISRRITRIFPMYWIFSFLVIIAYIINSNFNLGNFTGNIWIDARHVLLSLFLIPQSQEPILGVGWTLLYEMLFYYTIATLLLFIGPKYVASWIATICVLGITQYIFNAQLAHAHIFSIFFIEFYFGAIAYRVYQYAPIRAPKVQLGVAILLFFVLSFALDYSPDVQGPSFLRVIGCGLLGFLLLTGGIGLETRKRSGNWRAVQFMRRVGDASYVLYLSHWFVLSALGKVSGLIANLSRPGVIVWHAFSVGAAILFAMAFHVLIEKPVNSRLRRLLPSRTGKVSPDTPLKELPPG